MAEDGEQVGKKAAAKTGQNQNNIDQMKPRDSIYAFESEKLVRYLDDPELQAIYKSVPQLPLIAADIFYTFYSISPGLEEHNSDQFLEVIRKKLKETMQTDAYREQRSTSELNEQASLSLTADVIKHLLDTLKKAAEEQGAKRDMSKFGQMGQPGQPGQDGQQGGSGQQGRNPQMEFQQIMESANEGNADAQQLINEMMKQVMGRMMRSGMSKAADESMHAAGKGGGSIEMGKRIKTLPVERIEQIHRMSKWLLDRIPKPVKTRAPNDAGDVVAGYKFTKDPSKALRREFAFPEDVLMARWSQGLLALQRMSSAQGAYYVLLDKSGSMSDHQDRLMWSRSVALALYKQSKKEGKKFYLRLFDDQTYSLMERPQDIEDAILSVASTGGTSIDKALAIAAIDLTTDKRFKNKVNTVILISDGEDSLQYDWPTNFKKTKSDLVAVIVGTGHNPRLEQIAKLFFKVQPTQDNALAVLTAIKRKDEPQKAKSTAGWP